MTYSAPTPPPAPARVPAGTNTDRDGVVLGEGPVTVDAFIDFLCPFCRAFEEASGPALNQMVDDGLISLVYHPLGFLDRLSTTRYSTRAASASGCAADAGRFRQYKDALFANQPPEGGPGLSDRDLVALGQQVGMDQRDFGACVGERTYLRWAEYVTARAMARGISGTPSTLVEGVPVPANAETIASAVAELVRG
jgi:protein-disulfide isomerase